MDVSIIGPFLTTPAGGGTLAAGTGGLFEALLGQALSEVAEPGTAAPVQPELLPGTPITLPPAILTADGTVGLAPIQVQVAEDSATSKEPAAILVIGEEISEVTEALAGAAMVASAGVAPPSPAKDAGFLPDGAGSPPRGDLQAMPLMSEVAPDDAPSEAAPADKTDNADMAPEFSSGLEDFMDELPQETGGQNLPSQPVNMSGPPSGVTIADGTDDAILPAAFHAPAAAHAMGTASTRSMATTASSRFDAVPDLTETEESGAQELSGSFSDQPQLARPITAAKSSTLQSDPSTVPERRIAIQDTASGRDLTQAFVPTQPGPAEQPELPLVVLPEAMSVEASPPMTGAHHVHASFDRAAHPDASVALRDARTPTPPAVEQVALQVRHGVQAGMDQFTIHLRPVELGQIDIRMDIAVDGAVLVEIAAERPETLELLQREARALERALQDAGLRTDPGSLSFNLRGDDRNGRGTPQDQGQNGRGGRQEDPSDKDPTESDLTSAVIRHMTLAPGRVDLKI